MPPNTNLVFDMETGDPDDVLTLILLLGHPWVNLKAVTITPGTPHQIAVVREVLRLMETDIPVGAFNIDHMKARGQPDEHYVSCVSAWHWKFLGKLDPVREAEVGSTVLYENLGSDTQLVTGAPVKNLGDLIRRITPDIQHPDSFEADESFKINWVAQGGFAGEGVVAPEEQLGKFQGMTTCPTYNLNGDPKSALLALESEWVSARRFVSKNVCHGVVYDHFMHAQVEARIETLPDSKQRRSLELLYAGMDRYLNKKPSGKAFHDPLAACCAINPYIGTWADVELYREKGKWGARLGASTNSTIITRYNHQRFVDTLLAMGSR